MKPHITLITLGTSDIDRAHAFYTALGLKSEGIGGGTDAYGPVAFFDLQSGLKLAVWSYESLAKDAKLSPGTHNPAQMSLAHNVTSRDEVDGVMAQARAAGALVTKEAQETFWGGYAGYFTDPDGHLWEVAWNPHMLPS